MKVLVCVVLASAAFSAHAYHTPNHGNPYLDEMRRQQEEHDRYVERQRIEEQRRLHLEELERRRAERERLEQERQRQQREYDRFWQRR